MGAVDTNVLVRLIARDDSRQSAAADHFIATTAWVPVVALVEAAWVLRRVYKLGHQELVDTIEILLGHQNLVVQDADTIADALELFRSHPALGFTDCVILETVRRAGQLPLRTLDRKLGKIQGAETL
jgi:predicted nucleic-acid-binding protein